MRTGVSASRIPRKPSLLWVKEVGPSVSSPVFADDTIYVSTITGRIFALNLSEKEIKWHLNVGSPIVSSPLIYNGILVGATYDSWIKDTSFTGKNFLLGIDSNYGTQIWNYEIPGGVFSSPCLVGSDGMTIVVGSMDKFIYTIEGKTGNILWTFETIKFSCCFIIFASITNKDTYIIFFIHINTSTTSFFLTRIK
jgi:outer membrane protein assembly factor BamB